MRWGGTSAFTWVRPLRRIICLLDGAVVPFDLRDGADDGHGLASADLTEGHRFHAPGAVRGAAAPTGQAELRERRVLVDAAERKRRDRRGHRVVWPPSGSFSVVDDPGLLDEVAGLVEWPVPLLGRIDADLHGPAARGDAGLDAGQPALLRAAHADGRAAPCFVFVANIEAGRRRRGHRRRQRARAARPLRRRAAFLGPRPQGAAGKPRADARPA